MMREGISERKASMSKTTRGKLNVDTRLGEEIEGEIEGGSKSEADAMVCKDVVEMTSIEGQRCGVNGRQE